MDAVTLLRELRKDPHGCPMCDAGKLRSEKPHWPECLWAQVDALLSSPGRTPIEDEALVASPHTTVFDTLRSTGEA